MTALATILDRRFDSVTPRELAHLVETAARQRHVLWMKLGARDDPGLAEGRQAHGLSPVELRVLERGQAEELR